MAGLGVEMFGSNNDQAQANNNQPAGGPVNPSNNGLPSFTMDPPSNKPAGMPNEPTASPLADASTAPHVDDPKIVPLNKPYEGLGNDLKPENDTSSSLPPASSPTDRNSNDGNDELIAIKQQALSQLSPIVQHLDQSPEEKFKTLMMMIQANDNQDLIKDAYAAAQQIPDEKAKSQALLDVVNEINYFTQKDEE